MTVVIAMGRFTGAGDCNAGDRPPFTSGIPIKYALAATITKTITPATITLFLGRGGFFVNGAGDCAPVTCRGGGGGGCCCPGDGAAPSEMSCAVPQYSQNF
jgi:hypothetical protein